MREKPTVLLDVPDFPAQRYRGLSANVSVPDSYLPTQRLDEPVEATKKSRLTRSTLADESNGAAGGNVDANVIECDYGTEAVRDVPGGERRRHALKTDSDSPWPRASLLPGLLKRRLYLILRIGVSLSRASAQKVDDHQKGESESHEHRFRHGKKAAHAAPRYQLTD